MGCSKKLVTEFNYFVKGKHPMYNGDYGTSLIKFDIGKFPKDFNIVKENQGTYYRDNQDSSK